ncbi:MAG: FUN14 domain-containing protein [Nitrospirota bacterium]|nr:FUN14 domain-containing protein [Nitrospirota bacterium]
MDIEPDQQTEPSSQGIAAALLADAPWRAHSVVAAGATMAAGLAAWVADYADSPVFAQLGGSYIGGFFIGWAFRRFLKMAALIAGGIFAAIAVLKGTGWVDLDWSAIETQILHSMAALQRGAEGLKQFLSSYLPSAGAAGAGTFFGFRKK